MSALVHDLLPHTRPLRRVVVRRAPVLVLAGAYVLTTSLPLSVAAVLAGVGVVVDVLVDRLLPTSTTSAVLRLGLGVLVTLLVVLTTDGMPEQWAAVPFIVVLVTASSTSEAVRRITPLTMATVFAVASAATGRGGAGATAGTVLLILGGGWYAARQGRTLTRAVNETARLRRGLADTTALLQSQAAMTSLDPELTITAVTEATRGLGFDIVNIGEIRDGMLHDVVTSGLDEPVTPMPIQEGVAGEAIRRDATLAVADYQRSPWARPGAPAAVRSVVVAPMRRGGVVSGVLIAASSRPRSWSAHERRAVEVLAAQASHALDNIRRFRGQEELVSRLRSLDQLKSGFLLSVSTDLRAPLTNVRGFSHTLAERVDQMDEAARAVLLDRLLANVDRLHDLIVGLLDFNRLRTDDDGHAVDLGTLAATVVDGARLDGAEQVVCEVVGDAAVVADEDLVRRVVVELVDNAVRHTPPGTPVTVAVTRHDDEVEVEVRDAGPGLSPPLQAAVRGDGDGHLLGLGLSVVVQVLAVHGSQLEVRVGDGTSLAFRLPVHVVDVVVPA